MRNFYRSLGSQTGTITINLLKDPTKTFIAISVSSMNYSIDFQSLFDTFQPTNYFLGTANDGSLQKVAWIFSIEKFPQLSGYHMTEWAYICLYGQSSLQSDRRVILFLNSKTAWLSGLHSKVEWKALRNSFSESVHYKDFEGYNWFFFV